MSGWRVGLMIGLVIVTLLPLIAGKGSLQWLAFPTATAMPAATASAKRSSQAFTLSQFVVTLAGPALWGS